MRVRCITTIISDPTSDLLKTGWWHAENYLTVDKEYEVYAISKSYYGEEDAFLICDDNYNGTDYYYPIFIPKCYFDIIDDTKPSFWSISPRFPNYEGPEEFGPGKYESLVDGDPDIILSFQRIQYQHMNNEICADNEFDIVFRNHNSMPVLVFVGEGMQENNLLFLVKINHSTYTGSVKETYSVDSLCSFKEQIIKMREFRHGQATLYSNDMSMVLEASIDSEIKLITADVSILVKSGEFRSFSFEFIPLYLLELIDCLGQVISRFSR